MRPPQPPRLATRLLERATQDPDTSSFLGDLHEIYGSRARRSGRHAAARWYWGQVLRVFVALLVARTLRALRPRTLSSFPRACVRVGRSLFRDKTYALGVLTTLTICLGANAAIYGVVHAVLLNPLPFAEPDRLVHVFNSYPLSSAPPMSASAPDYFYRRAEIPAFGQVAVYRPSGHTVGEPGSAARARGMRVSAGFFSLLDVRPALGRTFIEHEMEPEARPTVILTHEAWLRHFGGTEDALGQDLRIDEEQHTVVGVLPEHFTMPLEPDAQLFVPVVFSQADREMDSWHSNRYRMIARLADGATLEQAEAQNAALNDRLIELWPRPNGRQVLADAGYGTLVRPTYDFLVSDVRAVLYLLWAGAGFVLLMGCLNVGTLTLARSQGRTAEFATMVALGASRARVAGLVLGEAFALAAAGGVLGLSAGALGLEWLGSVAGAELPRGTEISVDAGVVLVTLVLAGGAALVSAVVALGGVRWQDMPVSLRASSRSRTVDRRTARTRDALVASQVGVAFVMLVGAGLMFMSLRSVLAVDPGFDPDDVLTSYVPLPDARYGDADARRRFWDELLEEVRAVPGVRVASVSDQLPFTDGGAENPLHPLEYEIAPGEALVSALQHEVGPGYFDAMGIEVVRGRSFAQSDGPGSPRVIVIDEWLADRFWPDADPLGAQVVWDVLPDAATIPPENVFTVVGVVGTTKQSDLASPEAAHRGAYYFTYGQRSLAFGMLSVAVETGEPTRLAGDLRAALGRVDPNLPLFNVATMRERIDQSLVGRRAPAAVLGAFGVVALLLAAVGIYGTVAYTVVQRTREIGIRMAMGASPGRLLGSVVSRGMRLTAVGLLGGGIGAPLLSRLIEPHLFQVAPADPRVLASVGTLLAMVAIAACIAPSRRATRVEPARVLEG